MAKQWARINLFPTECVSGVGDGGGENEGAAGVHAHIEGRNASYVRRRCLLHLPWRVADQGLIEMGIVNDELKSISAYIHDGVTWLRFKAIATQARGAGGLGMCDQSSQLYEELFGVSPPRHQDERPATDMILLQWLQSRQASFAKLAAHDMECRGLIGKSANVATDSLNNKLHCVLRRIGGVLVHKALFLFHYIEGKQHVALNTTLSDLFDRAQNIISDLGIDAHVERFLGVTADRIDALRAATGARIQNWVELCVRMEVSATTAEQDDMFDECTSFHSRVSLRMRSHLSLNSKNIHRTTWASARMLSTSPQLAKESANLLRSQLVSLRPGQATAFEACVLDDELFMRDLALICDDPLPACIWRKRGRTKYLFKFLADRFVGAPDSVGDSESIHAVWKRVEETRRGVKFKLMNALLKLRSYVREYSDLPAWVDIKAYVESIDAQMAALYNSMIADQGMRSSDTLYWERFNLRGTDLMLVRAAPDDINADHQANTANATADIAFGNYLRFLFKKHSIYRLARLGTASFFYVAENKSVAYRDAPQEGETIGRAISLVWLEELDDDSTSNVPCELGASELLFKPVSGDLVVTDVSISELSLLSGYYPAEADHPLIDDRTMELIHERRLLNHRVEWYEASRLSVEHSSDMWLFKIDVDSGVDIEQHSNENTSLEESTKMNLARRLQVRDNLSDDDRTRSHQLSKAALIAALRVAPIAPLAAAAAPLPLGPPVARGRGGRGRGRGRRGRGR